MTVFHRFVQLCIGLSLLNFLKSEESIIINSGGLEYQKIKGKVTSASGDSMENRPLLLSRGPPSDRCFATYLIFYIFGVGHLLPWNFFITANKVCTVNIKLTLVYCAYLRIVLPVQIDLSFK